MANWHAARVLIWLTCMLLESTNIYLCMYINMKLDIDMDMNKDRDRNIYKKKFVNVNLYMLMYICMYST